MKHVSSLSILLIILSVVGLSSCKPRTPNGILSQSEMEDILYDYHLAQGAAESSGGDVDKLRYLYVEEVFKKHGITGAEFDSSMVYYSGHPKFLQEIYGRLNTRFESEAKSMGVGLSETEMYANLSQYGDSANVWSGSNIVVLQNDNLHNLATFTMKADTSFHAGDAFQFNFYSHFLTSSECVGFVFFTVEYTDGQTQSQFRRLTGDYEMMIPIQCDAEHKNRVAKCLTITMYHQPDATGARGYFLITQPSLLRIHQKKEEKKDKGADDVQVNVTDTASGPQPKQLNSTASPQPSLPAPAPNPGGQRMTPDQFRESKPVEKTIRIVKERSYTPRPVPRRGARRRMN